MLTVVQYMYFICMWYKAHISSYNSCNQATTDERDTRITGKTKEIGSKSYVGVTRKGHLKRNAKIQMCRECSREATFDPTFRVCLTDIELKYF